MDRKQAEEALAALRTAYPALTWAIHDTRAGRLEVYGERGDVHRVFVRDHHRGGYAADTLMRAVGIWQEDHDDTGRGMGDTPVEAVRDAITQHEGRWDDDAAHRAYLLKTLREGEALLLARLDEVRAQIAALEVVCADNVGGAR